MRLYDKDNEKFIETLKGHHLKVQSIVKTTSVTFSHWLPLLVYRMKILGT